MRFRFICILIILLLSGCNDEEEGRIVTMIIEPETVMRPSVPSNQEIEHMIVNDERNNTLYLPLGSIEGFEYVKGFKYTALVDTEIIKDPPLDSGNIRYRLVKIISKEKV